MADISKITLPSGTTYNIKDEVARRAQSGAMHWLGITTTALTDGATTTRNTPTSGLSSCVCQPQ